MSYFSNASAPPAVAIPHDGSFTLPEAEVMTVEQVQSHHPDRAQAIRTVEHMGMPRGLAEQFVQSARDFSYRFWIIDNSGSMGTNDGHRVETARAAGKASCPARAGRSLAQRSAGTLD